MSIEIKLLTGPSFYVPVKVHKYDIEELKKAVYLRANMSPQKFDIRFIFSGKLLKTFNDIETYAYAKHFERTFITATFINLLQDSEAGASAGTSDGPSAYVDVGVGSGDASVSSRTIFPDYLAAELYQIAKRMSMDITKITTALRQVTKYLHLSSVIKTYDSINAYLQLYSDYDTSIDHLAPWRTEARPVPQHKTDNIIIPEIAEKIAGLLPYFSAMNNLNQLPLCLCMDIYDIIINIIQLNSTFAEMTDNFLKDRIMVNITVDDVIIGKSLTKPTAVKLFIAFNKLPDKAVNRVLSRAFCNELFDTLQRLINGDMSLTNNDKAILMSYVCTINVTDESGMIMFDIAKIYDSIFNFTKIAIDYEPFEDVLRQFRVKYGGKSPPKKKLSSPKKKLSSPKKKLSSPKKKSPLIRKKLSSIKKKSPLIRKKLSSVKKKSSNK